MAHHIFRRCLLADVVPPVPPMPPVDDRCSIGSAFAWLVDGVVFAASVGGLDVMAGFAIVPIPPGVDTGDSRDRLAIAERFYPPGINTPGFDLWGGVNEGGIQ